jgi:HTH-type transcriptional regulator / antitoxin HigA
MTKENRYCPDVAIPPGETLADILEQIGMTQAELAERTGRPYKTINEIIKGKAAITPETAIQFEAVLKVPARFWNNLEMNYRETLARIEEREILTEQIEWLNAVPVKAMIEYGWIKYFEDKIDQLKEIFLFFSVASVKGWEKTWDKKLGCVFRKSEKYELDKVALAVWLRKGQIESEKLECQLFDTEKFCAILPEVRKLTSAEPDIFVNRLRELCASAGVAVVFVRELKNVPVNGVTYWLNTNKAVIQLSLRYKTDDHLWFSFFHEAGHILKHGKRDFYDELTEDNKEWELEANEFAANYLIEKSAYNYLITQRRTFDEGIVKTFASSVGIAPGIVVGRLQYDGRLTYQSGLNRLKRRFKWS